MVGNELELFNVSLFVCAERQFLRLLTNKNKFARTLRRETVTNRGPTLLFKNCQVRRATRS